MIKFNLLNYVVWAVVGLSTVPTFSMDDKAAKEEIENIHQRIMDPHHAGYLGLTQDQREGLRNELNSSKGTPQDKIKSHSSLLEKMHAENMAKETEKRQKADELFRKAEQLYNQHLHDEEIRSRMNIVLGHASYLWLKTEQKQALFQILESIDSHSREETFKKFDASLKKMESEHVSN